MRLLAAPATRQQILHWYLERLLHQGWQYDGRFGTGLPEDHFEVFRSEEIIDVATWAQTDVTSYFLRDQVSHLPTLLASGRKLTVYSVELQACGRCRLSPYSHASPRPAPTIDLSPSCPEPYVSAQVQLSGAFSGSIDHTCGGGDGKPCEALTRPPVWHLEYLNLAINGHEVYLDSTKLRIAGPYTSDEQHWFYRPGPYYEPPQVSGGSIHLHVEFHQRMDLQDPPETLDVTAPCTSWFG